VLTPAPEPVTVPGTAFSAENMEHIEDGIGDAHDLIAAAAQEAIAETQNRQAADQTLQSAIAAVEQARQQADQNLQQQIAAEEQARLLADQGLQQQIAAMDPSGEFANMTNLINQKAPKDSPTFTGTPLVPSKTTAASSSYPTRIATEAQVALKANTASPALTGTPTAPTAAAKNNSTQIATTAYADRAGHPVGCYYTQYPVTGQSTLANMFPSSESPATLFGGTWTEMYASEDVFFRTGAIGNGRGSATFANGSVGSGSGTGTAGVQPDAIRNITGEASLADASGSFGLLQPTAIVSGAIKKGTATNYVASGSSNNSGYRLGIDACLSVPTDTTNHPKNRLIKVWKKTAS